MEKPGLKTTEFWLTILFQVAGIIATGGVSLLPKGVVLAAMALSALGYTWSRTKAKAPTKQTEEKSNGSTSETRMANN